MSANNKYLSRGFSSGANSTSTFFELCRLYSRGAKYYIYIYIYILQLIFSIYIYILYIYISIYFSIYKLYYYFELKSIT
jgi:hypothetical protein